MRKTTISENKDADQLCLLKSEFSRFYPATAAVQLGLCQTWSVTQIVGFLTPWLKLFYGQTFQQVSGVRVGVEY